MGDLIDSIVDEVKKFFDIELKESDVKEIKNCTSYKEAGKNAEYYRALADEEADDANEFGLPTPADNLNSAYHYKLSAAWGEREKELMAYINDRIGGRA